MIIPDILRLPMTFDARALVGEVRDLPDHAWTPHFNRDIYTGDWSGIALRSVAGKEPQLYPDPTTTDYADTAVLASRPSLARALAQLRCPTLSARLLVLGPGAAIAEHRDHRLGFDDGEVRLHVPIVTNPGVEFVLDGCSVELAPGECWYLNLNRPHRAANRSSQRRVHLVIDCVVDDWLRAEFVAALRNPCRSA